jgi:hypothetical protein
MRSILSWSICLALSLIPNTTGQEQMAGQPTSQAPSQSGANSILRAAGNGVWWVSLSAGSKSDFVDGYVTAMESVNHTLLAVTKNNVNELVPTDPQFKARTDALIELGLLADKYDYDVERVELIAAVNDFYKDPLNARIPVEFAIQFVRDMLNGKNAPKDLQKELNEWRAVTNK